MRLRLRRPLRGYLRRLVEAGQGVLRKLKVVTSLKGHKEGYLVGGELTFRLHGLMGTA